MLKTFDQTFSHKVLKDLFKYRILLFVSVLFALSVSTVLLFSDELMDMIFFPILLMMVIAGFVFTNWMHKQMFEKYGLFDLPFFKRFELLHYLLFTEELVRIKAWKKETLINLMAWQQIHGKNFETFKMFNSTKWVAFTVVGSASALFAAQSFDLKMNAMNFVMAVSILITFYIFSYSIYDGFFSNQRRDYYICKFLKMQLTEFEDD